MIPVTKTFLPPIEEYVSILQRPWDKKWITNRGELVLELEAKLKEFLSVDNIIVTNNGTIPLQIAIKALNLKGEIITTPFSYVATTSSIVWEGCKPVFVDIDPEYLTIDEEKIEAAITNKTSAILATHVFGNPCNVEVIDKISSKYGVPVIYDAAHCFGVNYKGKSLFNYGTISTCSFHATKLFHTGEGGAIFTSLDSLHHKLFYHHNFGHKGQLDFHGLGINAKISELQAAMGLAIFPYLSNIIESRKKTVDRYTSLLETSSVRMMKLRERTEWNYSYYPIIFRDEFELLKVMNVLNNNDIFPRRYFYPSLSSLNYVHKQNTPLTDRISSSILCLPLFYDMLDEDINLIATLILENVGKK